jgi:hypothetical protein
VARLTPAPVTTDSGKADLVRLHPGSMDRTRGPGVSPQVRLIRWVSSLAVAVALVTRAGGALAEPDAASWMAELQDAVARDLAGGAPFVVQVHVPLCDETQLRCGGGGLGDGDDPERNLYWATSGGFRGWFGRRGSGWQRVHRARGDGDVLEVAVWRRTVRPSATWRRRGVRAPFEVYVVAQAWRGSAIRMAMDAFAADLYGSVPREVTLRGGRTLAAGGAAHVVAYVGHNGWMDHADFDWNAAEKVAARHGAGRGKGAIAIACMTAPYMGDAVPARTRVPLLMTATLLFAGAHGFEGAVSAFAAGESLAGVRAGAIAGYASGQGKSRARVASAFTNPSDRRWRRWSTQR